jgi:hypothetical protein
LLALMSGRNLPSLELGGLTCAPRRRVGVPKTNFFTQVAPAKPAKWVPFQAGANSGPPGRSPRVPSRKELRVYWSSHGSGPRRS